MSDPVLKHVCPRCKGPLNREDFCHLCGRFAEEDSGTGPDSRKLLGILGLIGKVLVAVASLTVLFLMVDSRMTGGRLSGSILRFFVPARIVEPAVPPPDASAAVPPKPVLSNLKRIQYLELFRNGRFDVLTAEADAIQSEFETDPGQFEYVVNDFYHVFDARYRNSGDLLDAWVDSAPWHYAPYLARAVQHYGLAWDARGGRFASETSEEQFRGLEEHFRSAAADIESALAIRPTLLTAYILRIGMLNAMGDNAGEERAFRRGHSLFPASYNLYHMILWARSPRWGGSFEEMNRFALEAFDSVRVHPGFYSLFGEMLADQAWHYYRTEDYSRAEALYTRALDYGEFNEFYLGRSRVYEELGDYPSALADANAALRIRPDLSTVYDRRAMVYFKSGDLAAALNDLDYAEMCFPGDTDLFETREYAADVLRNRGHGAFNEDSFAPAIEWYNWAVKMNPRDAEAYYWRGRAHNQTDRTDLTVLDYRAAISCNPHEFKYVKSLDNLLMPQGRWEEIINAWTLFLDYEPGNSEAYLERAGAYHHWGESEQSAADLRKACDLGNAEACRRLGR